LEYLLEGSHLVDQEVDKTIYSGVQKNTCEAVNWIERSMSFGISGVEYLRSVTIAGL
jgi:hypothetical protein